MAKKKNDQMEQRVAELENQLKRAVADYRNLEQRVTDGRSELTNFVGGELIKRLLPVLDHLEIVVEKGQQVLSERSESKEWFKGVELAVREFNQVLQQEGLEEIPAVGEFNPALHEAVDTQEVPPSLDSSGEPKENMILKMTRKGYNLNRKVLRPAQVVVGRSESESGNQELSEKELSSS